MSVHFIPYVARPDLLQIALASIKPHLGRTIVVDNRDIGSKEPSPLQLREHYWSYLVWKPQFPLNHSQLLTWLTLETQRLGHPYFTWMHHDCEVLEDSLTQLVAHAEAFATCGDKWGAILTEDIKYKGIWNHVDVLAAINVRAALAINGWDWVRFPDYYSDYDFYGRLIKAGYSVLQSQLNINHQQGGTTTIKADANRETVNKETWSARTRLWELRRAEQGLVWPPV